MRFLIAAALSVILAACSGAGSLVRPMADKGPSIYIEPMDGDGFGVRDRLESYLAQRGYDPVTDPARATMRMRARYTFDPYNTVANVRITDAATGDSLYIGEGKNRGFGTMVNPAGALMGCFERALDDLPRR